MSIGSGALWRGTFYSGESGGVAPTDDAYESDSGEGGGYANDGVEAVDLRPRSRRSSGGGHGRSRSFGGISIHSANSGLGDALVAPNPEQQPRETFTGFEGVSEERPSAGGGVPYASTSMRGITHHPAAMNMPSSSKAYTPPLPALPAAPPQFA